MLAKSEEGVAVSLVGCLGRCGEKSGSEIQKRPAEVERPVEGHEHLEKRKRTVNGLVVSQGQIANHEG